MSTLLDERLESVAADLDALGWRAMFIGAGVLHRYLDVPAVLAEPLRPTEDVDALLHVVLDQSAQQVARIVEVALQRHGWRPDMRSHRRNVHAYVSPGGIPVDIVIDALYPEDDWPVVAQQTAEEQLLPSGRVIRLPSPALFLICKLHASMSPRRWEGPYESHDLEDVAQMIAGCSRLPGSVEGCPKPARDWLRAWSRDVLAGTTFGTQTYACLEGNWPKNIGLERLDTLLERLALED